MSPEESDLQLLASPKFLRSKSDVALNRYQKLIDAVVASKHAVVDTTSAEMYPGDGKGHVLQFATYETSGANFYLKEIHQCFSYTNTYPKRFYVESFANGIVSYVFFFKNSQEDQMQRLAHAAKYVTHFKMVGRE